MFFFVGTQRKSTFQKLHLTSKIVVPGPVIGPRRSNMTSIMRSTINMHCSTQLPHCDPIGVDPCAILLTINRLCKIVRHLFYALSCSWRRCGDVIGTCPLD
jgi:hypothetical protein